MNLIDVWNAKTFDSELSARLTPSSELIRNNIVTENRIFLEYDRVRGGHELVMRPNNPYAGGFLSLREELGDWMRRRVIRAWHYTRLTGDEVEYMLQQGLHVSTPATLKSRLHSLVPADLLPSELAETLYARSPFHGSQLAGRSGKFCVVSHPIPVNDSGVKRLLTYWGGEAASFWMQDPEVLAVLAGTGKARVLELAVPLALTNDAYSAAQAIVATFAQNLGCVMKQHAFDAFLTSALPPDSILQVHSEGDPSFDALGSGYPAEYVDTDEDYWHRLTGED